MIDSISASEGVCTFTWNAIPNATYQIEYKTNLAQSAWSILDSVTPDSDVGSFSDTTNGQTGRYYRIVAKP
jgi:hypothetical protein